MSSRTADGTIQLFRNGVREVKELLYQAIRFIGVSGVGWILDFCTYIALGTISGNVAVNNIISSWVGVTFVFIFATRKVFVNNSSIPLKWKYLIYLLYQAVLIYSISRLLARVDGFIVSQITISSINRFSKIISKIVVTPITMVMNFVVMKMVIEKI